MKSWIFRALVGFLVGGLLGVIIVGFPIAGYYVGLNKGFDTGYNEGVIAEFNDKESIAIQGCEIAAMQMRESSRRWRYRAENCQHLLDELLHTPPN